MSAVALEGFVSLLNFMRSKVEHLRPLQIMPKLQTGKGKGGGGTSPTKAAKPQQESQHDLVAGNMTLTNDRQEHWQV